jgi:hypothetical protein
MSKRKREDDIDDDTVEKPDLKLKVSRLKARVQQSVKALHNALKLARGFERQKLGRRQKNANDQPRVLLRLREEVIVLKQLNLEKIAKDQLLKHLRKLKRIKEHTVFLQAYGPEGFARPAKSGAEANLIGRLFNSNPVKEIMSDIMKVILKVLGLPQASAEGSKFTSNEVEKKSSVLESDQPDFRSLDGSIREAERNGLELSALHEDDQSIVSHGNHVLSSEDDASNDMSSSDDVVRLSEAGNGNTSVELSVSEVSESDDEEAEVSHEASRVNKATFIPSLSMGGYYSGSESEEERNPYHGPALPKPRKNRRGQRARQQLAEQKYGQNAKHLTKKKYPSSGNDGWDPKRGAVGSSQPFSERLKDHRQGVRIEGGKSNPSKDPSFRLGRQKTKDDAGLMHPSWEAAKKRKMQSQNQANFQGKKITFD